MRTITASDAAKAVVRRNTEEVQGKGRFDIFEQLFADDFVAAAWRVKPLMQFSGTKMKGTK